MNNKETQLTAALASRLSQLEAQGLRRTLHEVEPLSAREYRMEGKTYLQFASNDYLGLMSGSGPAGTAAGSLGSGASRLITGTHRAHRELEEYLAEAFGAESALLFNSGYAANVSLLSCLFDEGDTILLAKRNHASLVDGARLSAARLRVFQHRDLDTLESALKKAPGKKLIVTDTIFSMDGDVAPLPEICGLAEKYGAEVYADEAHAWGVVGPQGRGVAALTATESRVTIRMGTFGKAAGAFGAAGLMPTVIRDWCIQTARGFVYSTSLPPALVSVIRERWAMVVKADDRRNTLQENARDLRAKLQHQGFDTGLSTTQIIPVILGTPEKALALHRKLRDQGLWVPAIRWPTVPRGTDRLRISLNSEHTREDADRLAAGLGEHIR
jgi:8-amino-7-oxononanoate synthase